MTDIVFTAFNGGEVSPDFLGRTDQATYYTSVETMRNMLAIQTGAARSRGGSMFVAEAKRILDDTRLRRAAFMRFSFSDADSYIIEVGHLYFRFFKNRAPVGTGGPFVPTEIVTPYSEDDLFDADGLFQIQFAQSNDFLYLAHPTKPPMQLTRTSDIDWQLTEFTTRDGGPFMPESDTGVNMTYSGQEFPSGVGTLTASAAYFVSEMLGTHFFLRRTIEDVPPWQTGKTYILGNRVHNGGIYYECVVAGTGGVEPPTHLEGTAYDGGTIAPTAGNNAKWVYLHAGFSTFRVTNIQSSTVVDVEVLTFAQTFSGFTTPYWREGAWSALRGYPRAVQFRDESLWWAGTAFQPVGIFKSEINNFENYAPLDPDGQVTETTAFTRNLTENNPIRWLLNIDKGMLIGTLASEWIITTDQLSGALTPTTAVPQIYSRRGSASIYPHQVGDEVIYTQVGRRRLRDIVFSFDKAQHISKDLNVRADHILRARVVSNHWAEEPHHIMWNALENGEMAGLTYNAEEEVQVKGWHRHELGGEDASVEFIEGMPSPAGSEDDAWLMVSRTINGVQRRYIEYMTQPNCDISGRGCYLDSALGYSGTPITAVSGATHLANTVAQCRVDGKNHPDVLVDANGDFTLNFAASEIEVGYYANRRIVLLPIEFREERNTSVGREKIVPKIRVRVVDSVGGEVGIITRQGEVSELVPIEHELAEDEFQDLPPIEVTGLSDAVSPEGEFTVNGSIVIEQNKPQPLNMTQIVARVG